MISDIYIPAKYKDYILLCNGKDTNAVKAENQTFIKNIPSGKYTFEM